MFALGFGGSSNTLICTYWDPIEHFITEMFAGRRFDSSTTVVLVDLRRSSNIHIRDRIVILSTMLPIPIQYGAPDIDPVHVAVLMEVPVLTVFAGISGISLPQ